jgi:hypothetical protein
MGTLHTRDPVAAGPNIQEVEELRIPLLAAHGEEEIISAAESGPGTGSDGQHDVETGAPEGGPASHGTGVEASIEPGDEAWTVRRVPLRTTWRWPLDITARRAIAACLCAEWSATLRNSSVMQQECVSTAHTRICALTALSSPGLI